MRASVIGSGSWGTAVAAHLALRGKQVSMWAREPEVVEGINRDARNPLFLDDIQLPSGIDAHGDLDLALQGAQLVVMAVPSRWTREVAHAASNHIPRDAAVLNLAKGFDYATNQRLSEAIAEELKRDGGVAVLSGPNHAEEVARKVPSATVIASRDQELSRILQSSFSSSYLRVYTNSDVVGVEVGGAYKNVIALAAGMLDGLGLGDNTKATLITRGLAEMARFGSALGANPMTFSGLSGIGDLIVTCISRHSRNRGYGERLGAGDSPAAVLEESRMVVEGIYATRAVIAMSEELKIDIPIARGVHAVLQEKASPEEMLEKLMTRSLKEETEESLYRDFLLKEL